MIPTSIFAADYETPHEFSAGDTISADMMNEIFNYIKEKNSSLTMNKLIGNWSCEKFVDGEYGTYTNSSAHYSTVGTDNLWRSVNLNLEFKDDGDGTFSWSSTTYHAFYIDYNDDDICDATGQLSLYNNELKIKGPTCLNTGYPTTFTKVFRVLVQNKNRIIIELRGGTSYPTLWCDKQDLPPTTPATFTASVSGKTVSLAWTDSSTDETGFKVLRKNSLTGSYSTITTTSADATSYSDTVTAAGSYWYRVSATNSNGDSIASKMVKVDVE